MTVIRVPAYSPEAVAEHAVALMLTLNGTSITHTTASVKAILTSKGWSASTLLEKPSESLGVCTENWIRLDAR
jgi:lactate dehydrogenase-like 2-hydroxyacid dehydrogenase